VSLVGTLIDTLNRNFAGGNENASDDMGAFILNCDRIREETGAGVAFIHHEGAEHKMGGRGHTSLVAATDTVRRVEKNKETGVATVIVERQKDAEEGDTFSFRTSCVKVGTDHDGDDQTSLVIVPTDKQSKPSKPKLTKKNRKALDILARVFEPGF
jgi:RecA-family ATPase